MSSHKTKVCPRCGQTKTLQTRMFTYKVINGKHYWKHCRACDRKEQAKIRARRRQDPAAREAARAYGRSRYDTATATAMRRRHREKARAEDPERYFKVYILPQRFKQEGRKQRHAAIESHKQPSHFEMVSTAPLRTYLQARYAGWERDELQALVGESVSNHGLLKVFTAEQVTLDLADRLLTLGLGRPDLLIAIYPMET